MTLKVIANNLQKENLSAERAYVVGLSLSVVLSIMAFAFQNDMVILLLFLIIVFVVLILANRILIRNISSISDPPPPFWRNCFGWLRRKS